MPIGLRPPTPCVLLARRSVIALASSGLGATSASADPLYRNGNPDDGKTEWHTNLGMARDAVRDASGKCYSHVGEIVVCGQRRDYRIPPGIPQADRSYSTAHNWDPENQSKSAWARLRNERSWNVAKLGGWRRYRLKRLANTELNQPHLPRDEQRGDDRQRDPGQRADADPDRH